MTKSEDRRAQPRASLESPAVAYLADQRVDCRAVDISIGGIALWSPVMREPGQFLRVNFSLAPPGGIPRWYDADGVVVRVGPRPSGILLGVQFVVVEDRVARDIHGYVAGVLGRDDGARVAGRMPDALNPPPFTGEFYPPEARGPEPRGYEPPPIEAARRRRTAEYGTTETPRIDGPAPQANAPSTRPPSTRPPSTGVDPLRQEPARAEPARPDAVRPAPAIPRTRVAAPTAPPPVAIESEVASKRELERLFREALSEVDSGAGGRKDRRTK